MWERDRERLSISNTHLKLILRVKMRILDWRKRYNSILMIKMRHLSISYSLQERILNTLRLLLNWEFCILTEKSTKNQVMLFHKLLK